MNDWDGFSQDVTPVLRALADYKYGGLKAAMDYRYLKGVQNFVLNYPNAFEREFVLMYYDEIMETLKKRNNFRENVAFISNATQGLGDIASALKDEIGELVASLTKNQNLKKPVAEGVELIANLIESIAGIIDENSYKLSNIIFTTSYAEKNFTETLSIISADNFEKVLNDITASSKNLTLTKAKDKLSKFFNQTEQRSIVIISKLLLPSWENFDDFVKSLQKKASVKIPVINIFEKNAKFTKIYSNPFFAKRTTEFLVNNTTDTIADMAKDKIMNYAGMKAIIDQLLNQ